MNCCVFHKFIYNSFRDLLIFTISNLYLWTGLITVIYFILVVYEKQAKKLEKEYLKSENITNQEDFLVRFLVVIAYGIIKLTKVFIILNLWINNIIYQEYLIIHSGRQKMTAEDIDLDISIALDKLA